MKNNTERLRSWLLPSLFLLLGAYHLIGILPVAPIVGDGVAIANGATQASASGEFGPNPLTYRYDGRSGVYALIVLLHKLTGLDSLWLFSLTSGMSGVVFVLFSAALVHAVTGTPFAVSGIVVLLFQEAFTGAYYANTPVIAGAFVIPALYLLKTRHHISTDILGGALIGVAIWMRFDVLLLAPVCLLLLHHTDWKQTIYRAFVIGVTAAVVAAAALYLSNANLDEIIASAVAHKGIPRQPTGLILAYLRFFSLLLVFLISIGLFYAVQQRNWAILATSVIAVLPFYVILGGTIVNTKLMYYYIPFFALPAAYALARIQEVSKRTRRYYISLIAILFAGQYVIGTQSSDAEIDIGLPLFVTPIPLTLLDSHQDPHERLALVLGNGVARSGYPRLISGILYAPLWWYVRKIDYNREVEKLSSYIANLDRDVVNLFATGSLEKELTLHILLRSGYSFKTVERGENATRFVFTKGKLVATATALPKGDIHEISARLDQPRAVYVTVRGKEQGFLREQNQTWEEICELAYQSKFEKSPLPRNL